MRQIGVHLPCTTIERQLRTTNAIGATMTAGACTRRFDVGGDVAMAPLGRCGAAALLGTHLIAASSGVYVNVMRRLLSVGRGKEECLDERRRGSAA